MRNRYMIESGDEHYACTVDMLWRAGMVELAYEFEQKMPIQNSGNHVLLSNMLATVERFSFCLSSNYLGPKCRGKEGAQIPSFLKDPTVPLHRFLILPISIEDIMSASLSLILTPLSNLSRYLL
ncbi:hypothetical protein Peur_042238 [Populus x canadensis]